MERWGDGCLRQNQEVERRLFIGRRRSSEEGGGGKTTGRGTNETVFFCHGFAPVPGKFGFVRFLWFALKLYSGRCIYLLCSGLGHNFLVRDDLGYYVSYIVRSVISCICLITRSNGYIENGQFISLLSS